MKQTILYFFLPLLIFSNSLVSAQQITTESTPLTNPLFISDVIAQLGGPDTMPECVFGTDTLIIVMTSTSLSCNGNNTGTASVEVIKGVPPYTYSWFPSGQTASTATGLGAGTPSVDVIDGLGNICNGSISITEPAVLNVIISPPPVPPTCFGLCNASATASPSGGTAPYTYLWNTSPVQTTALATGLCAGNNTVSVTDSKGCSKVRIVNITQPALLTANGTYTNVICYNACNGRALVAPTGGTAPYTYSWMPGGLTTATISALCPNTYTCTITDKQACSTTYVATITQPTALTVTTTGTNLLCNGVCTGSVTATASGGVPGYTYSWSPGGCTTSDCTGLCAGNYTLTLTDANGCVKTSTVAITQPGVFSVSPTGTNNNCFGDCNGTASANPSGGTAPFTYSWSPGGYTTSSITGLCSGSYTVDVTDANSCATAGIVTITEAPLLTVTVASTNVTCSGTCNGSVSATPSGGTAPYTYLWSPGGYTTSASAGLCAGNYSVTVTDVKGCTATATVSVNSPAPLLPNVSSTNTSCFGICDGSVSASPTGGTGAYTYGWSNGCTTSACAGLCAGNYTLTLTDANGCPASATLTVTQPGALTASISSATPNPLNCNGDCNGTAAVSISGGTPLYTYSWTTGDITPSVTGLCAGIYSVTVTDSKGCTSATSVNFLQPGTLSVTIASSQPTCSSSCNGSISAIAGGGTAPYAYSWLPGGQTTGAIGSLCPGNYTVTTTDSKGCTNTQTVVLPPPSILTSNISIANTISCAGVCDGSLTVSASGGVSPYNYLWSGGQTSTAINGLCAGTYTATVTDANGCNDIDIFNLSQPAVLSTNISSTTSSCTLCTGTADATTTGGTAPYTYLWTPTSQTTSTAVGLCIESHTVSVNDSHGCLSSATVTINPVVTVSLTVSGASVSCPSVCDGMASAAAFGGVSPYTYSWTTAPVQTTSICTGLCAGTYSVTAADVNGCLATKTLTLTDPPTLTVSVSSSTASCGICNGTASASVAGGTGAYTYTWSGFPVQTTATATGLCAGDYTVTVADGNNCTSTSTVTVGSIPAISDNPSTTLTACGGNTGAICLAPTGGTAPYTYVWLPGGATTDCITGLVAGVYTVTVSDAVGCAKTFQDPVGNIGAPTITTNSQVNPICYSECNGTISISASGGVPGYNYLWSPGNATTTSISSICAGTYIIQVDDAQPCTSFASITITDPTQFSVGPTITNTSCNGGSDGIVCLSPSGGVSPYTYKWLPGGQTTSCLSSLSAGTYSVVVNDATGCDDTIAIPVADPAPLNISISSTNVLCNGNNNGTATASVSGGTPLYTYAWNNGAPLSTVVGLSPGNYSLTVTDSKGCSGTASVAIAQPTVLTSTLSSTNISCNSVCDGTVSLSSSGGTPAYSYVWLPGGATTSSVTALCNGNYVGTLTDMNGCTVTKTVTITQPAVLSSSVVATDASCFGGCDGSSSINMSGGTSPYLYTWSPGGQTTSSITGLCAGDYTVSVTDANNCNHVQFISISSPTTLQANVTNTIPTCFGGCDATATASPIGGTGTYTFSWNTSPIQTTATATGLCSGNYTLTLTDANGCIVTQAITVGIPSVITQSNAAANATCGICDGSIAVIASGGNAPYSFFWNTGATTATITGLCAGVYIDTVMDASGCLSLDTIAINNVAGPLLVLSGTNIACYDSCTGTATVSATGAGPTWQYSWFPGNISTQTITGLCANQYFVTVTDTLGCKSIDNITLTQPSQIISNAAVTNATCLGICNGAISVNASGGVGPYVYAWSTGATTTSISNQCPGDYVLTIMDANSCATTSTITIGQNTILTSTMSATNNTCNLSCDGTASVVINGGTMPYSYLWLPSNNTTVAVTALCVGTHTVTTTDIIGCQNISTVLITEPLAINANTTFISPTCNGSCDGSISSVPVGGTLPYTFQWAPGGETTAVLTGLCAGNYSLTITDVNNCVSTNTFTLTEPSALSAISSVVDASCSNVCDGSIDLTASGGTGAYSYTWMPGLQTTEDISALCTATYSVTVLDSNNCSLTHTVNVAVGTSVVSVANNDSILCSGSSALLISNSINASTLEWYQITSPIWTFIGNTSPINTPPVLGISDYALVALNGLCSDTDTVVISTYPIPLVDAGPDAVLFPKSTVILNGSGSGTYLWSPSTGLSSTTIANPVATPSISITYTLTVTDANGCTAFDTVHVEVIRNIIVNDGISPNNDGSNDIWEIKNLELFPNALVQVYNRWGELLFSTSDYLNNKWDGTYKGKDLPVGTYYYVINLKSDLFKDPITGPITILR